MFHVRRLLINLCLSYCTGVAISASGDSLIAKLGKCVVPEDPEEEQTTAPNGKENPMLRRLRKASKSTLQLQTAVLADEGTLLSSKVVVVVLGPIEMARGLQVRDC